jgi:hypothetical protein
MKVKLLLLLQHDDFFNVNMQNNMDGIKNVYIEENTWSFILHHPTDSLD